MKFLEDDKSHKKFSVSLFVFPNFSAFFYINSHLKQKKNIFALIFSFLSVFGRDKARKNKDMEKMKFDE